MKDRVRKKHQAFQIDQELLEEIYDTYQRPIYRHIFRQVDDVETARDLTADVFYRLLQAVQNGKGPSRNVKAWLYRTAHNIVVDHYRRQQFRRHDPLEPDFAAEGPDPSQMAENQILADTVHEAFTILTPEQRQVISLKFLDGLTNQEAADVTGKSTGAVKSLQHRALVSLQRELNTVENDQQRDLPAVQNEKKGMNPSRSIPKGHQPLSTSTSSI